MVSHASHLRKHLQASYMMSRSTVFLQFNIPGIEVLLSRLTYERSVIALGLNRQKSAVIFRVVVIFVCVINPRYWKEVLES